MIRGTVFPNRQALLAVALLDTAGQFQSFEFILDTGFDGDLSLPAQTIQTLVAVRLSPSIIELADGSRTMVPTWRATALWDGERRSVTLTESEGEALLGMSLLWGNHISLAARAFGDLVIERLGVTPGPNPWAFRRPLTSSQLFFPVVFAGFPPVLNCAIFQCCYNANSKEQSGRPDLWKIGQWNQRRRRRARRS